MGSHLGLRKLADKSGKPPKDGKPWPLAGTVLLTDPPKRHSFSADFVARESSPDGGAWLEVEGMRLIMQSGYDRNPVVAGDAIVLHVLEGRADAKKKGGKLTVRYKIVEPPGRYADASEPSGFRVSHEYRVELEGA